MTDFLASLPAPVSATSNDSPQPASSDHKAPDIVVAANEVGASPDSRAVDLSAPVTPPVTQPEPLPNTSFEHSTAGWEASNAALTLVRGVQGRAVRITRATTEQGFAFYAVKELISKKARAPYKVGAFVRSATPGMFVCLRVEEYAGGAPTTTERCSAAKSAWQRMKLHGRTARKGAKLVVSIHVMAALGGKSFDVDGFRLGGQDLG